ncbi:MAG: prephenate dehydrogenase [Ramlibacter sp.]|nr:prephenate dehydrogenase [Ramlibacter sp.]
MTFPSIDRVLQLDRIAVIGLGLIGGSVVQALRGAGYKGRILGYDVRANTLQAAKDGGWIDETCPDTRDLFANHGLVVLCQPVSVILSLLSSHLDLIDQGRAVVVDVASVKLPVLEALGGAQASACFVPCHPIAGRAEAGWYAADPQLFSGRPCIMTPGAATDPQAVALAHDFWTLLGARVALMAADEHDRAYAAISHLPQVLSYAYLHGLAGRPAAGEWLRYRGTGFQGFSRLGSSDAGLWADIAVHNAEPLIEEIDSVQGSLALFRDLLVRRRTGELTQEFSTARDFHALTLSGVSETGDHR